MKFLVSASAILFCVGCDAGGRAPNPAEVHSPKQQIEGVLITSLPAAPGRVVTALKGGFYCQFFQYSGTGDYGDRFRQMLDGVTEEGKKLGANAFVNAAISSESHEIQGSKWHSSVVHICGDFVVLE